MSRFISVKLGSSLVAAVLSAVALAGCVLSPLDRQSQNLNPLTVAGFAIEPSATIQVKAYNYVTKSYDLIGTTTSASTASVQAGTMCSNSPAFYVYQASVRLGDNNWSKSNWNQDNTGWPDVYGRIQVTQVSSGGGTLSLYGTREPNAVQCIGNNITPGCNFYDVAQKCGFTLTEITLHIIG